MTDYYLGVVPQSLEWELRSNVRRFSSPDGGVTRTHERVGSRWAATFSWEVLPDSTDAARLRAFLASQRGGGNRFWVTDPSYSQRGSYAASELLTSSDLSSLSGWSLQGASGSYAVYDREIRLTRTIAGAGSVVYIGQSAAGVAYAPYAMRVLTSFASSSETNYGASMDDGASISNASFSSTPGLRTASMVIPSTTVRGFSDHSGSTGAQAGDYRTVQYASLARCAFVDNGTNLLQRSDEFDNAFWTKAEVTITANVSTPAPDGSTTSDALVETAATSGHYAQATSVTVSASATDVSYSVALRANSRTWAWVQVTEATGSTSIVAYVNLSTGAVGTTATGANWANLRTYVTALGNSWYRVTMVARKTNAATSLVSYVGVATADTVSSYTGTAALVAILAWRATLSVSSVPARLVQTTSAASTGASQTGGALYLKGLPASTSGLLLAGDWVEIITPTYSEMKRLTAPLNSDAAGLGYLQFEPILRQSPADNAAVIIRKPLCRMLLDESTVRTSHRPGGFMSCSFTAVEDIAA